MFEIGRKNEMKLIKKKNKEFDNKCSNIYNHIKILKLKEENYKKKLSNLKQKEKKEQKIQEDKLKIRLQLEQKKKEKNKELIKKKENIKKLKNEEHIMLKETKDNNIFNKKKRYQSALSDKVILKKLKKEIDNQQNNRNFFRHEKVKQQRYEKKAKKLEKNIDKKNEEIIEQENDLKELKIIENKMIKTFYKLELMEKECMKNLAKTKNMNSNYEAKIKEKKKILNKAI